MNKARRKEIDALIKRLEEVEGEYTAAKEAMDLLKESAENLRDDIATVKDEEQEYYDNMPENMQQGEKGSNAESAVSELESAHDLLESFVNDGNIDDLNLEDVIGHLDNAKSV